MRQRRDITVIFQDALLVGCSLLLLASLLLLLVFWRDEIHMNHGLYQHIELFDSKLQ